MAENKKRSQLFILITIVMTLYVGCVTVLATDKVISPERYGYKGMRFLSIDGKLFVAYGTEYDLLKAKQPKAPDPNCESIFDLPDHLLLYRNYPENSWMFSATGIFFEVNLTEETEFSIFSEINIGALSFGILNSDTDTFAFEYREIDTEDIKITLEAGNYEFLLSGDLSNGTLEITSENDVSD